jgi:TonB family protein
MVNTMKRDWLLLIASSLVLCTVFGCAGRTIQNDARLTESEDGKAGRSLDSIESVIESRMDALRLLYQREHPNDPNLKGEAIIEFEVSPSGKVTQNAFVSSTLGSDDLKQAVLENIVTWVFPPIPDENGSVRIRLRIRSSVFAFSDAP